ncbi:MAG: MFS transporter [Candidatus Saccharimonadales bacterium]
MIQRLIYFFYERRHYWRDVTFSEMAELYASRALRTLAVSMVTIFIGVYLYQLGYDVTFIMLYFASYFLYRGALAYPFAYVIARIGPKHATLLSNFLYVPALLLLVTLPQYGLWALVGTAVFQGLSVTLYDMAYLVGFSKVHHNENAGKELGYMNMLDQIAKGASPIIGGFVAYLWGPQATLLLASGIFASAAIPLFFTPEPVRTHQTITFHGLPRRKIIRGVMTNLFIGCDVTASGLLWSLFLVTTIFSVSSNAVYAELGVLSSITLVTGVIAARLFGLLVDKHRGHELLRAGVVADSLTHMVRPFIGSPVGVGMVNVMNEMATTAYALPYTKAVFAQADDLPGYRIVYMSLMSAATALGASLFCVIVAALTLFCSNQTAFQVSYGMIAVIVLGISLHGFPALRPRHWWSK